MGVRPRGPGAGAGAPPTGRWVGASPRRTRHHRGRRRQPGRLHPPLPGRWATNLSAIAAVFVVGEVTVTWLVLAGGRHPPVRRAMARLGAVAVPVLLCCIGVLVMVEAGTFSLL